jgi:hypothetical protein
LRIRRFLLTVQLLVSLGKTVQTSRRRKALGVGYRSTNANLRTQLLRIIERAGVKAWPKLFHNLRPTRQTELAEKYPIHVVCAWLGNSQAVAQEHYLQITDAHYAHAAQEPLKAASAAQNPAQYPAESRRNEQKVEGPQKQNPPVLPGDSTQYSSARELLVTPMGFEPMSPP